MVAYTTNAKVYPVKDIVSGAIDIYYNKPFEIPAFETIAVSPEVLDKYVGVYSSPDAPKKWTITRDGGTLFVQPGSESAAALEATAQDKFQLFGGRVRFRVRRREKPDDPKTRRSVDSFHEGKITVVAAMELQIRGVSKTYPNGVHALKDVTLTIPAGMYGLLGPNGAGKSTLMRMIATLQEPDTAHGLFFLRVQRGGDAGGEKWMRRKVWRSWCGASGKCRASRPT